MTYWMIPCNPSYYNVDGAFKELNSIDWKQSPSLKAVEQGDYVYIYVSKPIQAVCYYCQVTEVNKPMSTIDDTKFIINGERYLNYGCYMTLKLIENIQSEQLTYKKLVANGLKSVQGPQKLSEEMTEYFKK